MRELCDPTLQQHAKFVFTEPGVADDAAHGERVHRVVSGNRDDPDIVGHDDVLALPGDPKARLLQSAYGVLMVDARYSRRVYGVISTSRTTVPSRSSSRTARYSRIAS